MKKAPVKCSADSITTLLTFVRKAVVAGRVHTDLGFKKEFELFSRMLFSW